MWAPGWFIGGLAIGLSPACADGSIGDGAAGDVARGGVDAALLGEFTVDAAAAEAAPAVADAAPDAAPIPCDAGDLRISDPATGRCYMYFATARTWDNAAAGCAALTPPAHLAVITSPGENALVATFPIEHVDHPDRWMGGRDVVTESVWQWVTGEPFEYQNWRVNEPNDAGGEDCMIMELDTGGLWDDRDCDDRYGYFCER
jgi:hypothetical protein